MDNLFRTVSEFTRLWLAHQATERRKLFQQQLEREAYRRRYGDN